MKSITITFAIVLCGLLMHAQSIVNYTFDKQGRLKSEHFESVYLVQFTYDKEGNIQSKTAANYTTISNLKDKCLKMFPNPTSDYVVIEVSEGTSISNINICDITGRMLRQIKKMEDPIVLQLADLKSGLYLIEIESEGKTDVFKLMKR